MSQSICSTGLRWLWLVVVVLIIDLGSKYLILQNFALGDTVPLFPSLNLHYARNYGAAFSFLADSGGWQRWFFAGIAIGISLPEKFRYVEFMGMYRRRIYVSG